MITVKQYIFLYSAYKELCPLDVDKENVIQEEIEARLARVEKIEMARPIKSSYGQPKITDFDHLIKIHTSSLTFKNLAHKTPTLQTTQACFQFFNIYYVSKHRTLLNLALLTFVSVSLPKNILGALFVNSPRRALDRIFQIFSLYLEFLIFESYLGSF